MDDTIVTFADEEEMLSVYMNDSSQAEEIVKSLAPQYIQEEYKTYCLRHNQHEDNGSAVAFLEWWFDEDNDRQPMEDELLDEPIVSSSQSTDERSIFNEWNNDEMILLQLPTSDHAAMTTLWRWENPMSKDKEKCSLETDIPIDEIEKWWNAVDWINGYVGGHFHPNNMTKAKLKAFLLEACNKVTESV